MPYSRDRSTLREIRDEVLMGRYVDGDAAAFDELFRRYERRAFSYFLQRTRSTDRARDLYQDLFLRIHRARDTYDRERAFAPWFFQIAHRLLIDDQRRAYRMQELQLEEWEVPARVQCAEDGVADRDHLTHLLDALSPEERHVLICAKGEGADYAEIAAQLGKSVDAVKKMASRALQRLRAASLGAEAAVHPQRP
jgi:RNA polymerase sigma-70 factor (ECF subfamily)